MTAAAPVQAPPRRRRWVARAVPGAAALWLAFVVAHRLLSGRAWWWNLPDLTPPPAFLAVPLLLLVLVALVPRAGRAARPGGDAQRVPPVRRVRLAGAAAALAGLALGWPCAGVNLATLWHDPPPAPPGAVTVFAWNTWYWDELADGERHDPDAFYRYLHAQAADVYLLQEYLYMTRPDFAPLPVADPGRLRREFPGFHIASSGELVTVSRYPIVLARPLDSRPHLERPWPDLPPAGSRLPEYHTVKTLRTDLAVAGRVVSFYNAHFQVPITGLPRRDGDTAWDAVARHDLRAANVRAVAADLATNPHPAVLAGDLNTSPAMRLVRTLPRRLVDATAALDSLYPGSWARLGLPLWRIDWFFATAEVTVHEYRMVDQGAESDHRGQHVVMSIADCPEGTLCR